jgi:uncharacterized protein YhdP
MAPVVETAPNSAAPVRSWLRMALLGTLGVGALFALILFAYELARARVPQHRAALERLVRAQTGLDVRFTELGLRWGWYGPEAVFRHVELDEPGNSEALLRAPELVVGIDAWRTLRSGHPEAGRIELIAPEIDVSGSGRFSGSAGRHAVGAAVGVDVASRATDAAVEASPVNDATSTMESSALGRIAVLQRWRGGRIDIEGGMVRLPAAGRGTNPLSVQIRQATLRRSDDEWNVAALLFLPDRVGRSARVTLRVQGDLSRVSDLKGSMRVEARRLLFPGARDFLGTLPDVAPFVPRGGNGDLTVDVSFDHGQIAQAHGTVHAGALVFDAPARANLLVFERLNGNWKAARLGTGWRVRVDSLDLAKGERLASLTLDTGEGSQPESPGRWIRGRLEQAPLEAVLAVTRWLAPHFDLAGIQLEGTARSLAFDWASGRAEGQKLRTAAQLEDVALTPRSNDFVLGGLSARVSGSESDLSIDVQSRTARLELKQSQQMPLADVHVSSTLRVTSGHEGWKIETDEFLLEHQRASLSLSGSLQDDPTEPRIFASGSLTGADIALVARLLGDHTAEAFGAAAARLTAGQIQNAEFSLRGPISRLPFEGRPEGFTGSLTLHNAILAGGDLWPDAEGVDAHVEWHGAQIQAIVAAGHAGPFQLASAKAQWGADGRSATRLTGHLNGRLEDAIAWVHDHPHLQEYAPDVGDIDAKGDASFDFNVSIPPSVDAEVRPGSGARIDTGARGGAATRQPQWVTRVSTFLDGATVQAVSGLPPLQGVTGSFVFDAGHLQRSVLTGTWLGGPVTLHVGERREKDGRVLAVQAQGTLNAAQLASLSNATGIVEGRADWSGEFAYLQSDGPPAPRWRMRADSNLLGVMSSLPEPFTKRSVAAVPVHLEVTGTNDAAQLHANVGDRLRSVLALKRTPASGWSVDRGAVRFGAGTLILPSEPVVLVRGRINRLDLPAYALAWQRLRQDSLPTIRAQMVADEMLVGSHRYDEVSLQAERTAAGTNLLLDSAAVAGIVRWPAPQGLPSDPGIPNETQRVELHFTRLNLPDEPLPGDGAGLIAALAPAASLAVDELNWHGRSLGRLTATVAAQDNTVATDDMRLVNGTHDANGVLRCQTAVPKCRMTFMIDSTDAAATLAEFGFKPDLVANAASLNGEVEWRPSAEQSWIASLRGTASIRLADGTLTSAGSTARSDDAGAPPFALLAVPALVSGLDAPGAAGASLTKEQRPLHFDRLEADFELQEGQATTSNLHFDGDAEILMRGRIGIVSRDYDQQVWLLRGEERLPAAVRHFGATPRVAAAWLSLRDIFGGSGSPDRSRAVLRLQGSWDDPMVVTAN